MPLLRARTFRIEAAVIAVACVSVVALALLLVQDAITRTEGTLRSAAERQVAAAAEELRAQYEERAAFSERPIEALPLEAQDLSLRGLSQTVLRSYGDVKGGFYLPAMESVLGAAAAGSQRDIPADEMHAIDAAVGLKRTRARDSTTTLEAGPDLLVAGAVETSDGRHAWALKRLVDVRDPAPNRRRWLLATIVLAAVAGVAGVVSILIRLRRGIDRVKQTLQRLESDFAYRPTFGYDDLGEIHSAIAKMADRRTELETSLRRQDRLAALGKVVAGVAHEIRNPLNSVRLQLELLKRKTQKGIASSAEVDVAVEQLDRLNAIVGQLLGFGKPGAGRNSPQEILPLARHSIEMVRDRAGAKGIRLEVMPNGNQTPTAEVDGLQIEQVLTNLLLNAIEASPEGASVCVQLADLGQVIEMKVTDQGAGIPEAVKEHVFDAFFTTRPTGTGLGLSVSREIVSAHGGTLDFTSSPEGTMFVLRLPARREP